MSNSKKKKPARRVRIVVKCNGRRYFVPSGGGDLIEINSPENLSFLLRNPLKIEGPAAVGSNESARSVTQDAPSQNVQPFDPKKYRDKNLLERMKQTLHYSLREAKEDDISLFDTKELYNKAVRLTQKFIRSSRNEAARSKAFGVTGLLCHALFKRGRLNMKTKVSLLRSAIENNNLRDCQTHLDGLKKAWTKNESRFGTADESANEILEIQAEVERAFGDGDFALDMPLRRLEAFCINAYENGHFKRLGHPLHEFMDFWWSWGEVRPGKLNISDHPCEHFLDQLSRYLDTLYVEKLTECKDNARFRKIVNYLASLAPSSQSDLTTAPAGDSTTVSQQQSAQGANTKNKKRGRPSKQIEESICRLWDDWQKYEGSMTLKEWLKDKSPDRLYSDVRSAFKILDSRAREAKLKKDN